MKLTWLAVAWLLGLGLAFRWYDAAPLVPLISALLFLCIGLIFRMAGLRHLPLIMLGVCLLGLWRFETFQAEPTPVLLQDEAQVTVRGKVANDPEATGGRIRFALDVETLDGQFRELDLGLPAGGARLLVYAHPAPELVSQRSLPYIRFGDWLELSGRLQRPQPIEGFDYPAYLESKGIFAVLWASESALLPERPGGNEDSSARARADGLADRFMGWVFDMRRQLFRSLDKSLPPEQAALAQALLLGLRGQLPGDVTDNFRQTGTSHLLAISGLHLGIFLLVAVGVLQGTLGRHTPIPLLVTLGLVWLYVLLSGAPPSVIRAALMGSIYLAALGLGRPRESLLPALSLSALVMTAIDPVLATQISFQLSIAAMAGIALSLPWQEAAARFIETRFQATKWNWGPALGALVGWATAGMVISAAATLATLPLVLIHFQQLPLLGVPATIIATPLLPFCLVGAAAVAALGLVHPLLGQALGLVGAIPLTLLLQLVEWTPNWTVAVTLEDPGLAWAWYGTLLGVLVLADTRVYRVRVLSRLAMLAGTTRGRDEVLVAGGRLGSAPSGVILLSVAMLVLPAAYLIAQIIGGNDSRLHVHFLDVGQGDSILIELPEGGQVLVDGGPDYASGTQAMAGVLPPWDRSLDLLVATHLDADHSRGLLKTLYNYRVGQVLVGAPDPQSLLYPEWSAALGRGGHNAVEVVAGQTITLDGNVSLRVLHPPSVPLRGPAWDANNTSVVIQLAYGEITFLLAGDIEAEAELYLVKNADSLESDVLKAAHHGSNSSSTDAFLAAVNPQWAVISAGQDNQYGHPHPEVLSRLEKTVGKWGIFDTASRGTISFSTDGKRLWVKTERGNPPRAMQE